jgi:hypothetical protein
MANRIERYNIYLDGVLMKDATIKVLDFLSVVYNDEVVYMRTDGQKNPEVKDED